MKKLSILIIFFCFLPLANTVHADDVAQGSFLVSPVKAILQMKLGDEDTVTLKLTNNYPMQRRVKVRLKSFKLVNNNTEVLFDPEISDDILHIVREFKGADILLEPNSETDFTVKVEIDENIKPGGYSFALIFENQTDNRAVTPDGSATFIKQSIGVPILLNVAGVEGILSGEVSIDKFETNYFNFTEAINIDTTVNNKTNEILFPQGLITIKKKFGIGPEVLKSDFNKEQGAIYSFTSRDFSNYINFNTFTFGFYSARLDIVYATTNNISSKEVTFLMIPAWFIIFLILLVFVFIYYKIRKNKVEDENNEDEE